MTRRLPFRRAAALVAAALALSLAPLGAASAAAAPASTPAAFAAAPAPADAVTWSVAPAGTGGADGRISLRHTIEPGRSAGDAIVVANTGATAATFEVRAGDGVVGTDGAFDIAQGEPADSGAWISIDGLSDGRITLAAGESRVLPITIAVPADAVPGDHPAGIVVGIAHQGDGVTVRHRIGVRAHLQVAGDIAPALEVSDVRATYSPSSNPFAAGTLEVHYTVANTGNVRLGASDGITVSGPFGLGDASAQTTEPAEVLPGTTITRVQEVAVAPLAMLAGDVTVTPVILGDDAFAAPAAVTAGFSTIAVPWAVLIGLVVLAAVAVLVVWAVRRGRRRTQSRIDAAVAAARAADDREREHALTR